MSPIQTILGFWRSASASSPSNIDIEAQTHTTVVSGTHTPLPISLAAPAAAHAYAPTYRNTATNLADDFFGVTRTVRDSRHDDVRMSTPSEEMPPPYLYTSRDEEECLPAYDAPLAEPTTLAQYLFRFGFLLFPFWILGAMILLSPLSAPADFHASKPEAERQMLVSLMRNAEVKWAKRCCYALVCLGVCVGVIVGVVAGVMNSKGL
ncbi:hypothetical protein FIBSPDRAFT_867777 [Athelia psychrophila]|uniref:Uncharacterized protein n=1 Tax=Athelia psychrophila TaxID=1759441 RepID=A0A166DQ82_9AGAM|nr:hypothetical protein FIBSPDRAFT_867777 [Fibularhizoctonia sp. CBS 109695]